MSHILDALTKSAIEGSGIEIQSSLLATALLEAVERQRAANHSSSSESQLPRSLVADHRSSRRSAQPSSEELAMAMRAEQSEGRVQFPSVPVLIAPESRLVAVTDGESLAAEKFRFLAVRLRQLQQHRALKKVLITSTIPQEGKSMAAANLASTLARKTSQRVLLLEGDLRRPTLTQMFGLGKIPGLNEWLQRERASLGSIYYLEDVGLWFLPAGSPLRDPLELMQSGRLSMLMDQVSDWFDWIVIDSPPVPLADTSIWMRFVDGILLVARQGTSQKEQLQRGLEAIDSAKLLGSIINCSTKTTPNDQYYYRPKTEP